MSTWHQDRRPCIPPSDQWTIDNNPPNGTRTFTCFDTEASARKCLEGLQRNGHARFAHLIAPTAGAGVLV